MNQEPETSGPGGSAPAEHTAQEWASYYRAAAGALEQLGKLRNAFGHETEMWGAGAIDNPVVAEFIGAIQKAHHAAGQLEAWFTWLGASDVNWLKDALAAYELPAAGVETIARWAAEQNKRGMLAEKRGRKAR